MLEATLGQQLAALSNLYATVVRTRAEAESLRARWEGKAGSEGFYRGALAAASRRWNLSIRVALAAADAACGLALAEPQTPSFVPLGVQVYLVHFGDLLFARAGAAMSVEKERRKMHQLSEE